MTSYVDLKQLALDLGQPGDDPIDRLNHFAAIFTADEDADMEQWVAISTQNVYGDGVRTGLQLKDLVKLSLMIRGVVFQ